MFWWTWSPLNTQLCWQAEQRRATRLAARAAAAETPERAADLILKPVTHRQGSPTLAPALEVRAGHVVKWPESLLPFLCLCVTLDNRLCADASLAVVS